KRGCSMPRDPKDGGPNDRERLQHMLDAALDARSFVARRSRPDLDADSMLRRALVNALQVVGEAAARVSEEGRASSRATVGSDRPGTAHFGARVLGYRR